MEKLELLCIAGGNVKMLQPWWKNLLEILKKSNTELSYDPDIPHLGISPKDEKQEFKQIIA